MRNDSAHLNFVQLYLLALASKMTPKKAMTRAKSCSSLLDHLQTYQYINTIAHWTHCIPYSIGSVLYGLTSVLVQLSWAPSFYKPPPLSPSWLSPGCARVECYALTYTPYSFSMNMTCHNYNHNIYYTLCSILPSGTVSRPLLHCIHSGIAQVSKTRQTE